MIVTLGQIHYNVIQSCGIQSEALIGLRVEGGNLGGFSAEILSVLCEAGEVVVDADHIHILPCPIGIAVHSTDEDAGGIQPLYSSALTAEDRRALRSILDRLFIKVRPEDDLGVVTVTADECLKEAKLLA